MTFKRLAALSFALGLAAPFAWSQAATGNIYGSVADDTGAVLPGASVSLAALEIGGAPRVTTSGPKGEFRFLNLDRGNYKLTVTMKGFTTVVRDVIVTTGVNVNVNFSLKVAERGEEITVSAETPVVDTKKVGTATTFSTDDLTKLPQGRDPWALLNAVPGVIVDRVSIAGNEAGQQSIFVGKGSQQTDAMWNYDGVVITDVTSYGASSDYFDFDAFDEVNVTTGGGDLKVQTGGIGMNFVVKRGSNTFHGSLRSYFTHNDLQANNTPAALQGNPSLQDGKADHIEQINDWGFDLGGPIIKDKLWFWGSYNKNDNRLYRLSTAAEDKTILKNYNVKINWQASSKDQISGLWFSDEKLKYGRDPGYAGNNQAIWNQGNFYATSGCGLPCGMHGLFKLDWNRSFSPNFVTDIKYAYFNWGYGFDPQNGAEQDLSIDHVTDTAKGSAQIFRFLKPWHIFNADASYFFSGMGGNHELKFGFGYRHQPNTSYGSYGGNNIVAIRNSTDPGDNVAQVWREGNVAFEGNYTSAYLGDTFTKNRLTANVGVRWDRQTASMSASSVKANPLFPDLVPALTFDGNVPGIKWNDFSPRVSVSLALDEARKTVARASYARYAGQLGPIDAQFNSPITYNYNYIAYQWVDRNGDGFAQKDEILTGLGPLYSAGIDPANPTALSSLNKIDPNYHANHDNEIVVGIEHELVPNFSIGAAYTWRKGNSTVDYTPRIDDNGRILTSADFIALDPVSAGGYTVQPYEPNSDLTGSGARLLMNRPDYSLNYKGLEFTAIKRLSNKWMMRTSFSWMDWTEGLDGPNAFQNPTSADQDAIINGGYPGGAASGLCGPCVDGGIVATKSYGAKTNTFFNAKWQLSASGMYQLPWGLELGANLLGRQGFPKAINIRTSLGSDGSRRLLPAGGLEAAGRFADLWNFDMRLGKNLKLGGRASLGLTLDLFNVFNSNTILQQNRQVNSDAYQTILEITNPRILRLGARLQF
jgi:hypothetical protein